MQSLQKQAKAIETNLFGAKLSAMPEREKFMLAAIHDLADMETITSELSEWWKLEYFKRQMAAGFCFHCQGDGIEVRFTNGKTKPCTECHGKKRVKPRKLKGDMIPAGWKGSPEAKKS